MDSQQAEQDPGKAIELPPRAAYERWAPSYAESGRNPVSDAAARALGSLLPSLAGLRVLDLACGDGRWAGEAQASGAASILGLDFSAGMLMAARRRLPELALAAGDMRHLPLGDGKVDVVTLALALGHVEDPRPVFREIARCLAAGGQLALVDLHPNWQRLGWQRGFRDGQGRRFSVAWFAHAPDSLGSAARRAGLVLIDQVEGGLDFRGPATMDGEARLGAKPSEPSPDASIVFAMRFGKPSCA